MFCEHSGIEIDKRKGKMEILKSFEDIKGKTVEKVYDLTHVDPNNNYYAFKFSDSLLFFRSQRDYCDGSEIEILDKCPSVGIGLRLALGLLTEEEYQHCLEQEEKAEKQARIRKEKYRERYELKLYKELKEKYGKKFDIETLDPVNVSEEGNKLLKKRQNGFENG